MTLYDGSTVDVQFQTMSEREGLSDKTDVSPRIGKKHSLFFKRCLGRTGLHGP